MGRSRLRTELDIHFATVGGLGGIADTCDLYQVLGIPVSVIADLDVVSDKANFKRIVSSLIADNDGHQGIHRTAWQVVIDLIRHMPPNISEGDTRNKLDELRGSEFDWSKATDTTLRSELNSLSSKLYRMRALKKGASTICGRSSDSIGRILLLNYVRLGYFLCQLAS